MPAPRYAPRPGEPLRIQLLSPAGEIHRGGSGIFKTALRYAPLTLSTLAALVPAELNAEITVQDEGVQPLDLDFAPSLVGISAITGTAQRAYGIADQLRAKGHAVVIGGVHATLLPDEAAPHADAIVTSYAEKSWPQLLRDFVRGRMQPHYFSPTGHRLEGVPIARRDLLDRKRYATVNSIEATRGCPHKCDFCAVPAAWRGIYAHRPIEEVIAELRTFKVGHAVFIDLSPVEDVAYAKALYKAMIPLHMKWVGLATTRIAEDLELLRLAARSGCKGLLIGFESVSQATLEETRKGFHHANEYAEVVRRLHDHGIGVQGCFVFGFDTDDQSVFERTVEFVDRSKIDLPRYAVMTPFPGTGYFRRMEADGRLLHKNWALYDVEHVVFQPKRMSPERLQEGLEWAWRQSYSWRSMATRLAGAPWGILPLWVSLNLGYRYYAHHLPEKTGPVVYRDEAYMAAVADRREAAMSRAVEREGGRALPARGRCYNAGMSDIIDIDGSRGEGGGQVLRTSLALSLLTGKPFHLRHIRARRQKPGLQPQHLFMCVEAAAQIGGATLRGASLGSTDLTFTPGQVKPANYTFAIGTAGATSLVLHTVYLPLALRSDVPCEVTLTGGTHVNKSPAYHFLEATWRGYMEAVGVRVGLRMERPGFFPRGGGVVRAVIQPCAAVTPLTLGERGGVRVRGISAVAGLDKAITRRMARQAREGVEGLGHEATVEEQSWDGGPGAVLVLRVETSPAPTVFVGLGERGKSAEAVADEAVEQVAGYLGEAATVDEHSADQLLLPLALADGPSEYTVGSVTMHLLTNIEVIKHFVERDIVCEGEEGAAGRVVVR